MEQGLFLSVGSFIFIVGFPLYALFGDYLRKERIKIMEECVEGDEGLDINLLLPAQAWFWVLLEILTNPIALLNDIAMAPPQNIVAEILGDEDDYEE